MIPLCFGTFSRPAPDLVNFQFDHHIIILYLEINENKYALIIRNKIFCRFFYFLKCFYILWSIKKSCQDYSTDAWRFKIRVSIVCACWWNYIKRILIFGIIRRRTRWNQQEGWHDIQTRLWDCRRIKKWLQRFPEKLHDRKGKTPGIFFLNERIADSTHVNKKPRRCVKENLGLSLLDFTLLVTCNVSFMLQFLRNISLFTEVKASWKAY